MGWVTPDGHNDVEDHWTQDTNAYDDDEGTYASTNSWTTYLELLLDTPISCDKIRLIIARWSGEITYDVIIDVYYGADWHNIHTGVLASDEWVEVGIGSTQTVSKARIRCLETQSHWLYEFDFNEVAPPPAVKAIVQAALISIPPLIVLPTLSQILKVTGGC